MYFYHYNAHGDVIALTDEQGNIVARYQYDAWGTFFPNLATWLTKTHIDTQDTNMTKKRVSIT
ncbi:hypothetical protein B4119_3562 [Parageobacillus caldoxylosilyticus]|uniref:Wall-associated protein n=2 Tax=Saccharococcus caldoxylosilyticus TaxID=81408 RepID=A0A023DHC8_9BACL|nr:hypothetical protein B4119_3562 [Parageobacillus caldoxylosilyticus]MBB3852390.1 hemerythrin [Parageobacillus caldoxylosilyticus]GAJ40685.1 hypothetical protein GCA01S_048_00520 [Parageobacillus caldoxylosilyticus NBRC 107762]